MTRVRKGTKETRLTRKHHLEVRPRPVLVAHARQQPRILEICTIAGRPPSSAPRIALPENPHRDDEGLTRVVHEIVVVHDLRPVPEHGLERVLGALLALRAARPHLLLLPRQQDRVGLRVRDITQADAAQEVRQAPVVPELRRVAIATTTTPTPTITLATTGGRAVPGGVPRVLLEFGELLVDGRQHALAHDAARRVRDAEEEVRKLERRQGEPPALLFELARLAGDKFLRFGVEPKTPPPQDSPRKCKEGRQKEDGGGPCVGRAHGGERER